VGNVKVSVIVPVYNGENVLAGLLGALAAQTYPRELTEILVIDNNSVDSTRAIIESWANRGVTYLRCEKQSSYAARNMGISHATGEILAFTDADCRPHANWLQVGVEELRSHQVDRIAGVILLPLSTPPRLWELVDATTYILGERLAERGLIATANLLIMRSAVNKVGCFEETIISGGDMEFGRRCNELGVSFFFSRNVKIEHRPRGAMEQIRRSRRIGVGLAQITGEPFLARAAAHWRDLLPGASMAGVSRADFGESNISNRRWFQVQLMRYLAVDMVRTLGHLWGRLLLRRGRAERTLAKVSRSG
jgi:glycosyltransferase involved in cell wall biosynthesis